MRRLDSRTAALAVVLLVLGATAAWSQSRHAMRGMVLAVDRNGTGIVVSHDAVPGVMAAMTMPFEVRDPRELAGVVPGMTVTFTLVLGDNGALAERVRIERYATAEQDPLTARRLRLLQNTAGGGRPESASPPLAAGQMVPDVALLDQARRRVVLSQFRGQVVVVNFIYTSCALPQFCFRVANHFGVIQRRFKDRLRKDLTLVTVTFDPVRDQPETLAEYARQWTADADGWRFLTGPVTEIQRMTSLFGVDAFPDEGLMNHSVRTALVDRQGRLVANIEGNLHTAAQLGDLVHTALAR